jgi:hypothetical protein
MTKLIVTATSGLVMLALAALHTASVDASGRAPATTNGTATSVRLHANGTELVLRSGNHLVNLSLSANLTVTTVDGQAMKAGSILPGDQLTVTANTHIVDRSQRLMTLKGIVSIAPFSPGDPLAVQPSSCCAFLVDTGSKTRYTDSSHETSRIDQLEDADVVQVRGVYDSAQKEMTRTDSITRLGPYRKTQKHGSAR